MLINKINKLAIPICALLQLGHICQRWTRLAFYVVWLINSTNLTQVDFSSSPRHPPLQNKKSRAQTKGGTLASVHGNYTTLFPRPPFTIWHLGRTADFYPYTLDVPQIRTKRFETSLFVHRAINGISCRCQYSQPIKIGQADERYNELIEEVSTAKTTAKKTSQEIAW